MNIYWESTTFQALFWHWECSGEWKRQRPSFYEGRHFPFQKKYCNVPHTRKGEIERWLIWELNSLPLSLSVCPLLSGALVICLQSERKDFFFKLKTSFHSSPPISYFSTVPAHARCNKVLWIPGVYSKAFSRMQTLQGGKQHSELKVQSQHKGI